MKRLLIIDDFFGREVKSGRNLERESLCRRLGLLEFGAKRSARPREGEPLALTLFFRGQSPEKANIGDVVENDLQGCLARVEAGAPDGNGWDLLMLDLCFYTGEVTDESDFEFSGFPEGRPEDDDPERFFGLEFLAAVKKHFPELPVVVFSAHSDAKVQARSHDLGALSFIARDDENAKDALAEVMLEIDKRSNDRPSLRDVRSLIEIAIHLPAPTASELQNQLSVLKELQAVLLKRALRGALQRHHDEEGVSLLPALRLITGQASITTSQAADWVKRLVHQTRPHEEILLADDLIKEAYEKSIRLRPGTGKHNDDD